MNIRRRSALARALAGLLAASLMPSCSLFCGRAAADFECRSLLPPATVAYLLAEVCRHEMPGADPAPMHACPPVVRTGENRYQIRYVRYPGDGYRVFQNGRISPPRHGQPGSQPTPDRLRGCRFLPARDYTGTPAAAGDEVRIEIEPSPAGSRLHVRLRGSPTGGGLRRHLQLVLDSGDAIERTADLIDRAEFAAADRLAGSALAPWRQGCCHRHLLLAGRLFYHRALTDAARKDAAAMRAHLSLALSHAPDHELSRFWQARACERLGDLRAMRDGDRRIAWTRDRRPERTVVSPAGPGVLSRGAHGLWSLQRGARAQLRARDLQGAENWARRALDIAPDSLAAFDVLAQVHDLRGQDQRALERELALLERAGFSAELVLRLAQRYTTLGNHLLALRVLVRYQVQLQASAPITTRSMLQRVAQGIPGRLARRLLATHDSLLENALPGGPVARPDDTVGPVRVHFFTRLAELRRQHERRGSFAFADEPETAAEDGYRSAPGAVPPR